MASFNLKKIAICFLILFLQVHISILANEKDKTVRIEKLEIKGYEKVGEDEIVGSIATKFPSIKPWVRKPEFDEEVFNEDLIRLKELFAKHGYYDAKIDYELKYNEDKTHVKIEINIEEGPHIILRKLDVILESGAKDKLKEVITKEIPLKLEDGFSAIKFQKTKSVITRVLSNTGYPKLSIKADAVVNRKEKWAEATFLINPGELHKFGSVSIQGNNKVPEYLIRREISYKADDNYSAGEINDSQGRVFQLGYFRSVIIETVFNDGDNVVNTIVKVVERKLGNIRFGVGFGTEDKLRSQIGWTQRNFLGGGRSLDVVGKFSFITQRIQASITQPYFMGKDSEFVGILNFQRDDLPSFEGNSINTTAKINKGFGKFFDTYGSFNVVYARIDSQAARTPIERSRENVFLTSFGGGIRFDTTDSILSPTKGMFADFNVESALRIFQSDVNYIKSNIELRGYRKYRKTVFAKRLRFGVLNSFGTTDEEDIPIFKRFFAGGSTSMRGFPFQKLGPLDSSEDPIGGNSIIVGNLEARFSLYKDFSGVLFFDYGNVFPESFDYQLDNLRYAVGTGLRYKTIVGPIRLDFGYALNPDEDLKRFQIFISIGQAF